MPSPDSKYRIIDKLDSGGMAEIYRAEAELIQGFKKQVAIKRILPHLTKNEKFVAMFLDEARLSLYLDHANIVHVFDIGRSGTTYFIVMEYVDGLNLRAVNEAMRKLNRPITMETAIFLMMEVCKGLAYAHDMVNPEDGRPLGIVHRDVSPPNILLSRSGEVKLVDFGLAKAASQAELTDPGVVKGKFSYLSPEAASGTTVDHRADIFAVGIILFELLTGRRLFYGETDYQTVELVRKANIPSLAAINPAIPRELDQIVRQALARDPEQRYQHAYELQEALAQFLFARGMKVTSRDITQMVRRCVAAREHTKPKNKRTREVIDQLIHEEVLKITSLDSTDFEAQPQGSPGPDNGAGPLDPRDFIDPRDWTSELPAAESARAVGAADVEEAPEMTSLEQVLEGGDTLSEASEAPLAPEPTPATPPKKSSAKGTLLVLFALIVVAVATVLVLYSLGLLGKADARLPHDDIVNPSH